jgi:hypothetical protein
MRWPQSHIKAKPKQRTHIPTPQMRSLHRLQLQRRSSTQPIQEYLTEVVIIIGDQNVDFFGFNLLPEPGCIIIYRFQRKI